MAPSLKNVPEILQDLKEQGGTDYVARAIRLGGDRPGLARYHASMRAKLVEGPLCDAGRLATSFAAVVRGLVGEATRADG